MMFRRRRSPTLLCAATLAAVALTSCTVGSNLAVNGNFLAGTRDWAGVNATIDVTVVGGRTAAQVHSIVAPPPSSAPFSVIQDYRSVTLPVAKAGHLYLATADVLNGYVISVSIGYSCFGSTPGLYTSPTEWTHLSVLCNFPAGSQLDVGVIAKVPPGATNATFSVSNITLQEVTP